MATADDFYSWLSDLLQQAAQTPGAPPVIPISHWPVGSIERRLLEELQAALAARQPGDQDGSSQPRAGEDLYHSIFETARDGLIIQELDTGRVVEVNPAACRMYDTPYAEFVGQLPASFIYTDGALHFMRYARSVQAQSTEAVRQVHMRRDGSPFFVELGGTVNIYQGGTVLLSVVRDVNARVREEQLLQQRVDERTREQSTLLAISQTLASALELQPGLILDQLRTIIDFTHAGLFQLEEATLTALAVRGLEPSDQDMAYEIRLQNPEALIALFNERRSTRIGNVQGSDPPARLLRSLLDPQAGILLDGIQSWMWVPMTVKGRMIGAVGVAHVDRDFFTAHHADLALTVANQAAITIVNAELYEHAQILAALQERQRLAQNLHDAVNQSLFSAGLIAEVLPRLWDQNPEEGRQSLEELRRLMRGAQADLRLLLAELKPSTLTDADLGDLLRLLGNALSGRTNLPVGMRISGGGRLPAGVQVAFYRLCQEALNNIARHADASRVDIDLQYENGAVQLCIRDDGRGFDPNQKVHGHYGLSMMQERAAAVDAVLSINSQPGQGTEIVIGWAQSEEQQVGER